MTTDRELMDGLRDMEAQNDAVALAKAIPMTTDLVPVDNMAELDTLDPQARDAAVTRMLDEARSWLAHAKEASGPARIAEFKAFVASAADAARRVKISKEIQLDADEMVRRSERALGQAIRNGQAAGEIASNGERINRGLPDEKTSATEFFTGGQESTDVYALGDTPAHVFEEAVAEAKSEGNLSRANVVRKIKEVRSPETRLERADLIRSLAQRGYRSRQMATQVGVTEETVRDIARDFNIEIPADQVAGRTRRIDSNRVARETVFALEGAAAGLGLIDYKDLDDPELASWAISLTESMRALNRFVKQIKEMTQ